MYLKIIITSIVSNLFIFANGQDFIRYKSKFQISSSFGYSFPIAKLLAGDSADNFLRYSNQSVNWQIAPTYFFSKRIGVQLHFQVAGSSEMSKKQRTIRHYIENTYGDNYFINYYGQYKGNDFLTNSLKSLSLGLLYRYESNRVFIYPTISIGFTTITTNSSSAYLKEKNSNTTYFVAYGRNDDTNYLTTITTSSALGYKWRKRVYLVVDIAATYLHCNITFEKKIQNMNTRQIRQESIRLNKNAVGLNSSLGLIIVLK